MHNGMVQIDEEKMSKSVGNIFQLSEAIERYGGQTVVAYLASGHYRQPLAFSDEQLTEAAARVDRIRNYLRDAPGGDPDRFLIEKRQAFLDALADDFNTPQAFAVLFEIVAEGNRRDLPGARGVLEELLPLLGLDSLLEEERTAPPEAEELLAQRQEARATKDFDRADSLRDQLARDGLGGPRRGGRRQARPAPLEVADVERIYGRRPVAEAERGRRRVHRVWRAPDTAAEELERLCGSPDHQGVVAEVDPYPYADPDRPAQGRRRAGRRARPDPGSAQPRCGVPRGGGRRGGRRGDPGATCCLGDGRGVQGIGRGGGASARGARHGIWPIGSRRRSGVRPGSTAPPRTRSACMRRSSGPGAPCSCSARRGRGCGSAWRRLVTS